MAVTNTNCVLNKIDDENFLWKETYEDTAVVNPRSISVFAGTESLRESLPREDDIEFNDTKYDYSQNIDLKKENQNDSTCASKVIDLLEVINMNKLKNMAEFKADWDGQGAQAFSSEALAFFEMVLKKLKKQPDIAPTGRNSLYMQYKADDKSVLAFELSLNVAEMVYVPFGDYSSADTQRITENIDQRINECAGNLYGEGIH